MKEPESSVGIAAGYGLNAQGSIPGWESITSRLAVGPTQPPIQSVPGAPPAVERQGGVKATTHFYPMARSRMVELYFHPPYVIMTWCLINEARMKSHILPRRLLRKQKIDYYFLIKSAIGPCAQKDVYHSIPNKIM
jgi:hypothetical protein